MIRERAMDRRLEEIRVIKAAQNSLSAFVVALPLFLELPKNFQTSEFLLQHGLIDRIVPRRDLRTELARIIDYCEHE